MKGNKIKQFNTEGTYVVQKRETNAHEILATKPVSKQSPVFSNSE
jgi:hypothetical protein